ncbi:restriction endonuclease subunit S [Escherichia coli]|uniref:restriction endonuclease subunit S n=1 Tax=Escherichia coli TaxID=562 RepID=UPI000DDA8EB1|nr:restriction endonuclease subunit S [Escherichia coli]EFH4124383.1 restriction endonuclease subunit S [Escherichia coli]EFU7176331.1 restriction endonuclease subunit S [Escherichia coli]EGL7909901.1 restriction endonuclease subunit S [Escherichia coli]EHH7552770.1 restriction endonuclease subunit S [Escherichia coli]EHK9034094.1 restriction endonuclease subunit S [Escherichia coli]
MVPKGWSHTTFEKHIDCLTGYAFSSTEYSAEEHDIRLLRGDNIEPGKLRWINTKRWPRNVQENMDKYFLLEGDFVIALDRTWISGGLKVAEVTCDDLPCLLVQRVARIRAKKTLAQGLLRQYFSGYKFERYVKLTQTATAVPHISPNDIKQFSLLLPPIAEQKKIAQILSTWDKAISVTEKLLANSQQQKKALMQQLLTGKKRLLDENGVRFSGEWEVVRLKQLIHEEKKRNRDNHIQRVLSVTNHSGFVLPEEQFSKRVASEDVSTYKIVKKNQYGYNPSRLNVGSFARLDNYDEGVLSPMYVVFSINHERLNSDYFLNWMSSNEAKQRIAGSTQGSVRDSVGFDALCSFSFSLPTLMEQQKIAAVLSAADAEMSMLEKKLACLKEEKKALMQQLLTGKRRVNVESEETVSA